ncbi:type II toxin -antitoxin system TacA 1-like antitoxin [Planctomicrobium sp. SH527]|uniref:type II toxin -antitoxin system TacA 1-like antitoxin n=1 Tax=Planctomicrobium sp. SH527 TaxID=3448123 RepID=UPI003F5CBA1C
MQTGAMARKSAKQTVNRTGIQYGVRCSDEDSALFERASDIEGFASVQQWLLTMGRKRARQIIASAESGAGVRISETVIVPDEGGK